MQRRRFLRSSAGVVSAQILAPDLLISQSAALPISRTSRIFDNANTSPGKFVQDVVVWSDTIYCLYQDSKKRSWGLTVSMPTGSVLGHYDLPRGTYLGLAVQEQGILIHALAYYDRPNMATPNCILRLSSSGAIQVLTAAGGQSVAGRLHSAGDSFLLSTNDGTVEVWNVADSKLVRTGASTIESVPVPHHIDLLSPGMVALTRKDGASIAVVSIPSAVVEQHVITAPEILAAIDKYQQSRGSGRGNPVVMGATGSDHSGSLYSVVLPTTPARAPIIKLNSSGNSTGSFFVQLPVRNDIPAPMMKMLIRKSEMGITYANGSVAWYAI